MQESALLFKLAPYIRYSLIGILSILSGILVYMGLTSHTDRIQDRLRIRQSVQQGRVKMIESASKSKTEEWLKQADYPLGLNGLTYNIIFFSLIVLLLANYFFIPFFITGKLSLWGLLGVLGFFIAFNPNFKTLFHYVIRRVIDYRQAKKSAEVFMLYDLIINELEMMNVSRINTYNILKDLRPYFSIIDTSLTRLLTSWSSNQGPHEALSQFAKEIGTKEAQALITVIKTLDDVDRKAALKSLKGMRTMFVNSQIENYRRRMKITKELSSIPINTTHFVIILNFLVLVVVMVSHILESTRQ
ncbi:MULTISPECIES: hypothetical protein [Metabacillus]|uniref:hypothetical protein n=1 Tax=Metabacillus TaxID=2675233 RepID=UPI000C806FCD|nr:MULTISPECIES: hypothetical protein [Metabacillus]MCM3443574.1 hypothetical protein [Metabacillus halosaccharovorans]PMC34263.1 hypothetical protein CJ195_24420 [Bacillus sp. UMB0899]